jgi:hypothetical protein
MNEASGRGAHQLVLRNGQRYAGRLQGVTGDAAQVGDRIEFVFRTSGGDLIRAPAADVSYVHLSEATRSSYSSASGSTGRRGDISVLLTDGQTLRGRVASIRRNAIELADASRRGAARRLNFDQVAAIDFSGRDLTHAGEDWAPPSRGRREHVLVFRDGRQLRGRFLGEASQVSTGETSYLFREQGGRLVTFTAAEADRLYLTDGGGARRAREIAIHANRPWTRTGLHVNEGDLVSFSARGEVTLSSNESDLANPAGAYSGRRAPQGPQADAAAGALLGRVNGVPFVIGDQHDVRMPASGELELGVNDDHFDDNAGHFMVSVSPARAGWSRH